MKTKKENPNGLHQRFVIRKITGQKKINSWGGIKFTTKAVDPKAEYFVLRLDENGSDANHINACRKAIHVYADSIQDDIPELAKDIRERWPLPKLKKEWNKNVTI